MIRKGVEPRRNRGVGHGAGFPVARRTYEQPRVERSERMEVLALACATAPGEPGCGGGLSPT